MGLYRRNPVTVRRRLGTVQSLNPIQGLVDIYGSDLLEVWDAGQGITLSGSNVTSWRGALRGTDLTPPTVGQRPLYGVDTGYFLNKPVVQFGSTTGLSATNVNLGVDGDLMACVLVARIRTLPTPTDSNPFRYVLTCFGTRTGVNGDASYRHYFRMQTDSTRGWALYQRSYISGDTNGTHGWTNGGGYNANPVVVHGPVWAAPSTSYKPYFNNSTITPTWTHPAGYGVGGFKSVALGNAANTDPLDCMDYEVAGLLVFKSYTQAQYMATKDRLHAWMAARWGVTVEPLTGTTHVLDPANAVITSGKVEQYNGPAVVTQTTAGSRATYNASDAAFANQPTATFDGVDDFYPLGSLGGTTQGEMFVVLKIANDPPSLGAKSGYHYIGSAASGTHYPFTDGIVYDAFGTNTRKTVGDLATPLTSPHIYNVRSSAGNWTLEINGTQVFTTASNTAAFIGAALFGTTYTSVHFLDGTVAYMVLCNQVQTPEVRAAFVQYLKGRFGIP